MENLYQEIVHEILLKLSDSDLYSALLMCNSWNQSANNYFWRKKCVTDNWKDAYKMFNRYVISISEARRFMKLMIAFIDPEPLHYRN